MKRTWPTTKTFAAGRFAAVLAFALGFGGSVTFLESDFSKAFSGKAGEKLDYVTFAMNRATVVMNNKTYSLNDGSNAAIFGWAYTTSKATTKLSSTDKCYYQASYTQLDLDEVTYVTGSYRTKYTVYLPYTAVGTSGSRYEGYTAITVSGDDSITASGQTSDELYYGRGGHLRKGRQGLSEMHSGKRFYSGNSGLSCRYDLSVFAKQSDRYCIEP